VNENQSEQVGVVDLSGYIKIDIDNVARWIQAEVNENSFDWDKWIGSIICPFEKSHFTYHVKDSAFYASVVVDIIDVHNDYGDKEIDRMIGMYRESMHEDTRWLMSMACFYSRRADGSDSTPLGRMTITLDVDGFEMRSKYFSAPEQVIALGKDEVESAKFFTKTIIVPVLVAISLLHCKNIELVSKPVTRAMRRRVERTGKPMVIEKVLELEPFKRKVINQTSNGHTGLTLAMHICRGHFREYSEEKPLFGKYSGKYWIPQHARGDKGTGEISKDYKVKLDD